MTRGEPLSTSALPVFAGVMMKRMGEYRISLPKDTICCGIPVTGSSTTLLLEHERVLPLTVTALYGATGVSPEPMVELSQRRRVIRNGLESPRSSSFSPPTFIVTGIVAEPCAASATVRVPLYVPGAWLAAISTPNQSACTPPRFTSTTFVNSLP